MHPDLGDLAAFDRLIAEAHRRGIRMILDLVPNHTSDQHPWFVESRSSRTNPKRDWYIWMPGTPDRPPNNWDSIFGGRAWKYDDATGAWYLHMFLEQQPDLNFRNPEVVEAIHDVIRFWLDRGADGFRVDVVARDDQGRAVSRQSCARAADPDIPLYARGLAGSALQFGPARGARDHSRVSPRLDSYGDRMLVGESWPREQERLADYLRPDEFQLASTSAFCSPAMTRAAFARDRADGKIFRRRLVADLHALESRFPAPHHALRAAAMARRARGSRR